jgi:hypothetical protein
MFTKGRPTGSLPRSTSKSGSVKRTAGKITVKGKMTVKRPSAGGPRPKRPSY